jgi:hypothetical protein
LFSEFPRVFAQVLQSLFARPAAALELLGVHRIAGF